MKRTWHRPAATAARATTAAAPTTVAATTTAAATITMRTRVRTYARTGATFGRTSTRSAGTYDRTRAKAPATCARIIEEEAVAAVAEAALAAVVVAVDESIGARNVKRAARNRAARLTIPKESPRKAHILSLRYL